MKRSDLHALATTFRERAETIDALVLSAANGLYTVRVQSTGGEITIRAGQPTDTYAVGRVVTLRSDSSGRAGGGKPPIIIGYSQSPDNGVIGRENSATSNVTAATITALPSLPVQLVKNGPQVVVTISGVGLTGASYGSANIVDDVAQDPKSSALILRVKANNSAVPGRYSITVNSTTIPNFFEVIT